MKAGSKRYLFLGVGGGFVFLMNLIELLSGQGDLIDILEAIVFLLFSVEGFITYLRLKGKTQFHVLS